MPTDRLAADPETAPAEEGPAGGADGGSDGGPPRRSAGSVALTGLFLLALFYTLYLARSFVLPLVLALLFNVLLAPLVNGLQNRLRVPRGLGALVVLAALVGSIGWGAGALAAPAAEWLDRGPRSLSRIEAKLRPLKEPVERVTEATAGIEALTRVDEEGAPPRQVQAGRAPLIERLFARTREVVVGGVMMLVLLYFLLVSGDHFLRRLVHVLPTLEDRRRAVEIARRVQGDLSRYLGTITAINVVLGLAVWLAMYLLGMPNPMLWGAMATLFNFIPYVGALAGVATLALASILTFDSELVWALPPLTYFALTAAEGYFLTPLVLGRRMRLNPVVILLGLLFWGWLWGIAGAFLSVPLLVALKIFCDHLETLEPLGEFLGR
jgi:predicted PurR-regulated permease PerM